jgi:hypothetical protein
LGKPTEAPGASASAQKRSRRRVGGRRPLEAACIYAIPRSMSSSVGKTVSCASCQRHDPGWVVIQPSEVTALTRNGIGSKRRKGELGERRSVGRAALPLCQTFVRPVCSAPIHRGSLDDTGARPHECGHYEQSATRCTELHPLCWRDGSTAPSPASGGLWAVPAFRQSWFDGLGAMGRLVCPCGIRDTRTAPGHPSMHD